LKKIDNHQDQHHIQNYYWVLIDSAANDIAMISISDALGDFEYFLKFSPISLSGPYA